MNLSKHALKVLLLASGLISFGVITGLGGCNNRTNPTSSTVNQSFQAKQLDGNTPCPPPNQLCPCSNNTPLDSGCPSDLTPTSTSTPGQCNITGGTPDINLECNGGSDFDEFTAAVSALGGSYAWSISGGLKIVGPSDENVIFVEGVSPSGSVGDQSLSLNYTLNGSVCNTTTKLTVHKPSQLLSLYPTSVFGVNYLDDQGGIIGVKMYAYPVVIQLVDQLNLPMQNILVTEIDTEVNATKTTPAIYPIIKPPTLGSNRTDQNGTISDFQFINACCASDDLALTNIQIVVDHHFQVLGCNALGEDVWEASTAFFNPFNVTEPFPLSLQ